MPIADLKNLLPDVYNKQEGSNNDKLLKLVEALNEEFQTDREAVEQMADINKATGKTLDLYGDMVGQSRGGLDDSQYRIVILSKIARNACKGTHSSIVELLAVALECSVTDFNLSDGDNVCEAVLDSMPFSIITSAGLTVSQIYQIVNSMLPVGVKLADIEAEGTFEFSALEYEYDELAGFADDALTIGGYFGLLASDDINIPT